MSTGLFVAAWPSAVWSQPTPPSSPANACHRPAEDYYQDDPTRDGHERSEPEAVAAAVEPVPPPPKVPRVPLVEPPKTQRATLELSFGSAEKFYNQKLYDPGGFVTRKAIPVSTIRPLIDWFFQQEASLWLAFDLPLEPRSELRDEVVVQTYVPPSIQGGIRLTVVSANLLRNISLDLQGDGGLGWVLSGGDENHLFQSLGWRLHVRDDDGFTAYAGAAYEFQLKVGALVYGVGHYF